MGEGVRWIRLHGAPTPDIEVLEAQLMGTIGSMRRSLVSTAPRTV